MSGAILPLPQYAFMAWCSVTAQGQLDVFPFIYMCVCVYSMYVYVHICVYIHILTSSGGCVKSMVARFVSYAYKQRTSP
jgi:hypothetical protein